MDKPSHLTSKPSDLGHAVLAHAPDEIVSPVVPPMATKRVSAVSRRRKLNIPSRLKQLTAFGSLMAYFAAMAAASWVFLMGRDLPDTSRLWDRTRPVSVQFVDRQGRDLMTRDTSALS